MTTSTVRNTLLAASLMAGGLIMGGVAHATPGTLFTGNNSLAFDPDSATVIGPGEFVSVSSTQLEWVETGDPTDNHSFLTIIPPSNTDVVIASDLGAEEVARIRHTNNIIPVGSFDFTVDLIDQFTLSDATFALTGTNQLPELTLNVDFTETPNSLPCPAPNPLGSTCDDIFQIGNLDLVIDSFLFTANGEQFVLTFDVDASAGEGTFFDDAGNIIYTAENFISEIVITARIDQVPEPGTLALLGIGLAALPGAGMWRKSKKAGVKTA
ncbi:PEP-CTERM sorting domain-containing protein [Azoarcus sp. PA01]|nr:PEP-CTERM sorting domain-containing protein [Azoarcus sp. PA01]